MTFRAGDRVYIPSLTYYEKELYEFGWNHEMNAYCGEETTITMVDNDGSICLEIDDGDYAWSAEHLELRKPTTRPQLKPGDRVSVCTIEEIQDLYGYSWVERYGPYAGKEFSIKEIEGSSVYLKNIGIYFNERILKKLTEYTAF